MLSGEDIGGEGTDEGDRPEFNALHRTPGLLTAIGVANLLKAESFEGLQEGLLLPRAADAATPKIRVLLQMQGHHLIAHNVADGNATTGGQDPANVGQEPVAC